MDIDTAKKIAALDGVQFENRPLDVDLEEAGV